ncbi:sugar 3,4-ketoisomerase [Mucilaginibacter sp.]
MISPTLIHLPKLLDDRGNLSFLENKAQIPFDIKRVYWIYDVPGGNEWGGNAYRADCEVIIALSGSFDITVDNGRGAQRFSLNRSYSALYIPPLHWKTMHNFSTNSLALIVTDQFYNPEQYIRDWAQFKQVVNV